MKLRLKINRNLFVTALFIASVVILGMKLLNPTPIQIFIGDNETIVGQIPGYFTYMDVLIIVTFSITLGACGAYLLFLEYPTEHIKSKPYGELMLEKKRKKWRKILEELKGSEQEIYKVIMEADGIIMQSELVEKTGLSKSNVSKTLDLLESKGLIEKRRRGMSNIILLK